MGIWIAKKRNQMPGHAYMFMKQDKEHRVSSSEAECILRAQQGDEQAFAALVDAYQKPVYNLCYRMMGMNELEAEDAAQEAFWRAYQAIKRYDTSRPFATWLLSIAAHYCIDQQRKKRLPVTEIDDVVEETAADTSAPSPEKLTVQNETQRMLHGMLNQLNPQDRSMIILRYWYDYSEDEISQSLNLTVSAVKSRLHRLRLKLAKQWQAAMVANEYTERIEDESPAI